MGDERLRELERKAASGDEDARTAFARELRRVRDPRVVEVEALEARLQARLAALRTAVNEDIDRFNHILPEGVRAGRCPALPLERVRTAVAGALAPREGFAAVGWGYQALGRAYATDRPPEDMAYSADPWVLLAFSARLDELVVVRVGFSRSRTGSPGSVWGTLSPWRETLKPETMERRLRAYAAKVRAIAPMGEVQDDDAEEDPPERLGLAQARLWVDLAAAAEADRPAPTPARTARPPPGRAS